MFASIPLPEHKSLGDRIIQGMRNANALTDENLETRKKSLLLPYAVPTALADIASKSTYSNLMGPQFTAKMLGIEGVLPNIKDEDTRNALLNKLFQAGAGGGSNNFTNQIMASMPQNNPQTSMAEQTLNKLKSLFGGSQPNQQSASNPMQQMPSNQMANPIGQVTTPNAAPVAQGSGANSGMAFDRNGNNVVASPQEAEKIANNAANKIVDSAPSTYAENTGKFKGTIKEGEKQGEIRANDIEDFGKQYEEGLNRKNTFNELITTATSPVFEEFKEKNPFWLNMQMKALSKIGNTEQQEAIGNFTALAGRVVQDTLNSFNGTKMKGELDTAKEMKVSDNDTYHTMLGKIQASHLLNELTTQRSGLASNIMTEQHVNRQKALEIADKQMDGKEIRQRIDEQLHPRARDMDIAYMMKAHNLSRKEVMKRLKAKGHL